jgi:hypothetical protein
MLCTKIDGNGVSVLLLALAPENLEKLKEGHPLTIDLNEFLPELKQPVKMGLAYTPDEAWVEEQTREGADIFKTMQDSLQREDKSKPSGLIIS